MYFHDDLTFYTDSRVRSYEYINKSLNKFLHKIIFLGGTHQYFIVTLLIEDDQLCFRATNNFRVIHSEKISKSFNHMVEALSNFTIDITFKFLFKQEIEKSFDCKSVYFYYDKRSFDDEGIIESTANFQGDFNSFSEFFNLFKVKLSRELQISINKNIFFNDIKTEILPEIDADYEAVRAYSKAFKTDFVTSINECIKSNIIFKENKYHILDIKKRIDNEKEP